MAARRHFHARLAEQVPSEMSLETNMLRYLANCLERRLGLDEGGVTMTSPTQPQEKDVGFDAMAGLAPGRYVLLQFKRPRGPGYGGSVPFSITGAQLCTLLQWPPRSAFYVLPPIDSNAQMWDAKANLLCRAQLVDAWDFIAGLGWPMHGEAWKSRTSRVWPGGAAYIQAGPSREPDYRRIRQMPVCRLCCDHDLDRLGFVVGGGGVRAWNGAEWGGAGGTGSNGYAERKRVLEQWLGRKHDGGVGASADDYMVRQPDPDTLDAYATPAPAEPRVRKRASGRGGGTNGRGGPVAVRVGYVS